MPLFRKDNNETLDYERDLSDWLPAGDTIAASEWIVPTGITKVSDSFTTTTATIWLSGGTIDTDYIVVSRITTTQGRITDRTYTFRIRAK